MRSSLSFSTQPWALARKPAGNAADEFSEYYRLKDFDVIQPITKAQVLAPDFLDFVLVEFEKTYPLTELLNRCVAFANENY